MAKRRIWGFWDCGHCGTVHIRGDNETCPNCGHPRSADTKFYVDKNEKTVVEKSRENDRENWICAYCGSQNEYSDRTCEYCGASREERAGTYFSRPERETPDDITDSPLKTDEIEQALPVTEQSRFKNFLQRNGRRIVNITIIVLVVAVIAGIASWLMTPVSRTMEIRSFSWERSIEIEELQTFRESDWSLPADARLLYSQREIRSYDQVIDHYEPETRTVSYSSVTGYKEETIGYKDLGNGQFEEITSDVPQYTIVYSEETYEKPVYKDDPVWDTKYYYEINRWQYDRSVITSGHDKNPYWGEVMLKDRERQGTSHERYYIGGEVEGKSRQYKLPLSDWDRYEIGDVIEFKTRRFGQTIIEIDGVPDISSAK